MKVELLKAPDTDLDIVNAARVSYDKESEWKRIQCDSCGLILSWDRPCCLDCGSDSSAYRRTLKPEDIGLIKYLMREHHGTPFEMVDFKFRVRVPMCVGEEWIRHRFSSLNKISGRYVELQDEFFYPEYYRKQIGKPGHYTFVRVEDEVGVVAAAILNESYLRSYYAYQRLIDLGIAKEQARLVLPAGIYTQFIWKINGRSLMNFLSLRLAPNALLEIRQCAEQVYELVKPITPVMWDAWEQYRRPGGDEFHECDACDYHFAA